MVAAPTELAGLVALADTDAAQLFLPDFDDDGKLLMQPGERQVFEVESDRVGWAMERSPVTQGDDAMHEVDGRLIITNCRAVYVCEKWNTAPELGRLGKTAVSVVDSLVLDEVVDLANRLRARRDRKGIVLAGQVRWPWLASLSYTQKSGFLSRWTAIELSCIQATPALRNARLYLTVGLPKRIESRPVVDRIVAAVREDRLSADAAMKLAALQLAPAKPNGMRTLPMAGALVRSAAASLRGTHSSTALAPWRALLEGTNT